jgi:hypothetical protein
LAFAVGGSAVDWPAQESALREAAGAAVPRAFLKRLAQRRGQALPASMRTHADVSAGKLKKVRVHEETLRKKNLCRSCSKKISFCLLFRVI